MTRRKTQRVALDGRAQGTAAPAPIVRTLRGVPQAIDDAAVPAVGHTTWNQIARLGEYEGHPQGAFAFTPEVFAELVANFTATANRRVPVDYEHTSELLPANTAQQGVPAVAWITAVEDRGEAGLWAAFEWVDAQAVEYVRARRYLYVSPAVNFDAIDKVTGGRIGARLTSVALTNHPFLDGMVPLAATEDPTRLGLAPGDVHIPTGTHDDPKETTEMADKMDADKAKADAAKLEAAEPAEPAKMSDDENSKMSASYQKLRARVVEMAGTDPEAGEDVALEKLAQIVAEMQAAQKDEAAQMSERLVAANLIDANDAAKTAAAGLYLSQRKTFDALFSARLAAPKTDAGAAAPPKGANAVVLTERVADDKIPAQSEQAIDDTDPLAESRAADELASRLMSEGKHKSYAAAIAAASAEIRARRVNDAMSRMSR